jgi:hypothetical protein
VFVDFGTEFATTANAIAPGALIAGRRAIWQLGQVKVYDGENNLFMVEGVFIP